MRRHIALTLICAATVASAQPGTESPDSLVRDLREVEVTAMAVPRATASTAPMRVMDRGAMLRAGVADVSDALHRMPGVNLRDYGGAGGLKTVSVRGFGAAHTGVSYDGVPLSDVQTGQIDLSRYSIDNVAAVSMVVGDNDDIFIPARLAASAATVGISSLPVIGARDLEVKMRVGSFGLYNPFLRVGAPLGDGLAVNFVGEYTHADNDYPFTLRNGDFTTRERRTNSMMNSGHGELNMLCCLSPRTTLATKIYGYANSRRLPGPVIYYNNVSHERLRESNAMGQAQLRTSIGDRIAVKALLKYNFASTMYHDENGKYPGGVLDQDYWQREWYAAAAVLCTLSDCWFADYSADYYHNSLNSNLVTDRRPYRNSLLQSLTAKYRGRRLTVTARLLHSLILNGARRGQAARDASRLSPSLSLSWQPLASRLLYLRASYKNIFRMPTFSEAYFDHYGSADILPETTDQLNLGATYTLGRPAGAFATFALDGYVNHIRDMIVGVPYNMFVWRMVNLGKVRAVGLDATAEMSWAHAPGRSLGLTMSYSYQRAMPRTDPASSEWMKQVAYIPRHSGAASLSYENPWVNLSLSATGVSARYTTNNNVPESRIAGYVEAGASAWRAFTLRRSTLTLRLDIQNLLDKQYCVVARYPMPGRQYRLTLSLTP